MARRISPLPHVAGAVRGLAYGSIGVNSWGGQSFGFGGGSWGAFPGEALADVQSGIGAVRNYLFFDSPQKTVVRAPFRSSAHIGTAGPPPDLPTARGLCALLSNNTNTARFNEGNGVLTRTSAHVVSMHRRYNGCRLQATAS